MECSLTKSVSLSSGASSNNQYCLHPCQSTSRQIVDRAQSVFFFKLEGVLTCVLFQFHFGTTHTMSLQHAQAQTRINFFPFLGVSGCDFCEAGC